MKNKSSFCKIIALLAVVCLLLIGLSAPAEDTNNAQSSTTTNKPAHSGITLGDGKIVIEGDASGDNELGLSKDTMDRLSPEQIVELTKSRHSKSRVEDVIIPLAGMAIPIVLFLSVVGVVAIVISHRLKKTKLLHETIRAMIDKGQPIPPELLQPQEPRRRPRSDLRRGLVFIAVGVALLITLPGGPAKAGGLIPLLMGVAFLVTWKVEANKNGDSK